MSDFSVNAGSGQFSTFSDSLIISVNNNKLNSTDSLLQIEVFLKNNSKTIRNFALNSNSRGEVCWSPIWSIIITRSDSNQQYEPPFLLCNGAPDDVLRNNEEYRYNLMINFKWVYKPNSYHFPIPNHDYGEYSLKLILKTKAKEIISNTIKISFEEN